MRVLGLIPASVLLFGGPAFAQADAFDNYTNPILSAAPNAEGVLQVNELTAELLIRHDGVLPGIKGALVVVETNERRWAKLLVVAARQKVSSPPNSEPQVVPILRIERFVTYREASERAIQAEGKGISLFPGFHFHLDLGNVIPEKLGGDLAVVESQPRHCVSRPVGKAKIYLVTKPMKEAIPKKGEKFIIGAKFDPKYFSGTFKLHDDGRRSGTLRLVINDEHDVSGTLVSDRDGREYEVRGSVAKPNHKILFTVQFPQTLQSFEGMMFTGDGKAIAGISKLQDREAAFYAVRIED